MNESPLLTDDQRQLIQATLSRIRSGLAAASDRHFEEPAHIFLVEASDDNGK